MLRTFAPLGLILLLALAAPAGALAADADAGADAEADITPRHSLRANFKRVALDVSSINAQNAKNYQDSSVSALKADDQTYIKGVADFALEYELPKLRWDNSLYLGYGKTKVEPADGSAGTSSENEDMILTTSNLAYKAWKYGQADVGPFVQLSYQTEFTRNRPTPLNKLLRGGSGIGLFNGKYFSSLYIAGECEYDLTRSEAKNFKFAGEVGFKAKYPMYDGVAFAFEGYYRDYYAYSEYVGTDLEYDLNLAARLEVQLWKKLQLSPFVSYRLAKDRENRHYSSNMQIGISLVFSGLYHIW